MIAHIGGVPIEESVQALAPGGAALFYMTAVPAPEGMNRGAAASAAT